MKTHAEQEQQLLTYFDAYRDTINLQKFADAAGVGINSLKYFLSPTAPRPLSPAVLAKVLDYLKQQALALQVFI